MVMIFKSEKALNYLLSTGRVYTARPRKRREGKDWITNKYGGKKIADVVVKLVAIVSTNYQLLEQFLSESGFSSLEEWLNEVKKLNGYIPDTLYIYQVELVR